MLSPEVHLTPTQRAQQRVGSRVLKWRLDALLGVGGTAAVYAATHNNRSRVALKILHRELSAIPELRTRFLREAYVANSVGHEGAVQVIDDHLSELGEPVLVMQLLEGQSLDALQQAKGVLPADEALHYADRILDVLAAAHARGIVHRDVKPQNVFITTSGAVKVLDFGVARLFDGTASMTATGVLVGTPAFMPPEQAGGRVTDIGPPSDLWSVGATVFTLLTGRFVHEAENAQQHTIRAAIFPARSLGKLRPDLPAPLVAWVDRALAFEIGDRFQSAAEMQAALGRVRAELAAAPAPRASGPGLVNGSPGGAAPAPAAAPGVGAAPGMGTGGAPLAANSAPAAPAPAPPGGPPSPQHASAPDPAAVARQHGLPPPAAKRQLTRAEMAGIAGVFLAFVAVAALVVHRLAANGSRPEAAGSARPSAATAAPLSAWVGASASGDPAEAPAPDAPPAPVPSGSANKRFAEEARAVFDAVEADIKQCSKKLGPKGRMSVEVTFHPDGEATAQVELRFTRTPTGTCVEDAFRARRVSPFDGPAVTVTRMVTVPK